MNGCQLSGSGSIIIIPAGCFRENPSIIGKFNSITGIGGGEREGLHRAEPEPTKTAQIKNTGWYYCYQGIEDIYTWL